MTGTASSGWQAVELGTLAEFRNGVNYTKHNFGRGVCVINVKDFQERLFPEFDELEEINPDGVVTERSLLRDNDILFVRSNGNRALIGRSIMIRNAPSGPVTHSAFTIRARFTSPLALPRFYAYLFRSSIIRDVLSAHGSGTNISNLNQETLSKLKVPLPPLPTQRRIASTLSAYDDLIENNARRIAMLEEMVRRLYEEWFVHFRFPEHEDAKMINSEIGMVPEGWDVAPFVAIADVLSGGTPRKTEAAFWGESIPFYTPRDAPTSFYALTTENFITEAGLAKCNSKLYPKDTTFITARGTVGRVALASVDMAMNQSCYALRPRDGFGPLFLFLTTRAAVHELRTRSHGAVFDTIIIDTFSRLKVILPRKAVANRFENEVRPLFGLVLNLQRKNANLRAQRDLLLPKLISGEIDVSQVPKPALEAAE